MNNATIGIITFHSAINYGAILQAVALQSAFSKINVSCEIINYRNAKFAKQYGMQVEFHTHNPMIFVPLVLVKNFFFLQKKLKFHLFLRRNAKVSKDTYDFESVSKCADKYDFFVTGSDQVWNLDVTGEDTRYFLDFVPSRKKRSYAASFGKQKIEKEKVSKYNNLLSDFETISLREISGKNVLCQLHLNKEAFVHIDPTLLFDGNWWNRICHNASRKKYILFYKMAVPNNLIDYIEEFSSKTGIDVIEIGSDLRRSSKKFKMIRSASPEKFVSLIKNAEYIATTSFHATVFSILFHKKMILELVDATGKLNVRISDLLHTLGINVTNANGISCIDDCEWNKVDEELCKLRSYAFSYLRSIN